MIVLLGICLVASILICVAAMIAMARQIMRLEASLDEALRLKPDDREMFARVDRLGLLVGPFPRN